MSSTKLKTANIVSLDASKLTGVMPAISGANLTGVSPFTVSASDPVITTNPSGGLGTLWMNSTSGETYILTDATAGENVWTNVGGGEGNINNNFPYTLGGTQHGYSGGGLLGQNNYTSNVIDRFAFASSANATDVGDLSKYRRFQGMSSSATHGYSMGGEQHTAGNQNGGHTQSSTVDKFQFAASANASDVGDLTTAKRSMSQGIIHTSTHGFAVGGDSTPVARINTIDKWQFSTDAISNNSADLTVGTQGASSGVAAVYGYSFAGQDGSGTTNNIQKFSMTSEANATLLSSTTVYSKNGQLSFNAPNASYIMGSGWTAPNGGTGKNIEKFNFSTESDSALVSELFDHTASGAIDYWLGVTTSSTTHGYRMFGGGGNPSPTGISRMSFASEATMTDVGDMTSVSGGPGREDGAAFYT